jgi:hypothetical protein
MVRRAGVIDQEGPILDVDLFAHDGPELAGDGVGDGRNERGCCLHGCEKLTVDNEQLQIVVTFAPSKAIPLPRLP